MKKKIILSLVAVAALAIGVAGMSAFESHVINVTAKIENALTVPLEADGLSFGTVFPEEVANKTFDMSLSQSFIDETSVDDVQYVIRQKPKCICPPVGAGFAAVSVGCEPGTYAQVTEDASGNFTCPAGYKEMPLLCPFLSKHEIPDPGTNEQVGPGIDAFHGPLTGWTMADTIKTQVSGHLSKQERDTSDTWNIDLHAPCFKGECAQDNNIDPAYQPDPSLNSQVFGCDLWIEVTSLSTPNGNGTLTVTKIVDNTGGGTKQVADFPLFVDSNSVTSGVGTSQTPGNHTVTETTDSNYTPSFSNGCDSGGIVNVPSGGSATCTITNTFKAPTTGTLTVTKTLSPNTDPGKFDLQIDSVTKATDVGNGGTTGAQTVTAGLHNVGEIAETGTNLSDYNTVIDGDCASDGSITLNPGDNKTCTITNTKICKFSLDVMLDMDRSGSMGYDSPTRLSLAKIAADSFLGDLGTGDQSGLVSFSTTATLDKTLSNNHAATQTAVNSLTALGATDIGDAINLANAELVSTRHNPSAVKIEILVTDGMANKPNGPGYGEDPADVAYAQSQAVIAAASGIKIFTIGLGTGVDATMLQSIATTTGGTYYFAPTAEDLQAIFDSLKQAACH